MSIDQQGPPAPVRDPLGDYVARMRRQRWIYLAVLTAVVVVIVVVVQVVLRTGEIGHATLNPATEAAPAPTSSTTSNTLTQAWHSEDKTAGGVPFDQGTVVTYDAHTVSGRNYATGAVTWTYTRTDVSICTVFQETGITVAIFTDRDGFCDEADAFKTGTGARAWYRTLDSNGNTVVGKPAITATQYTIMIATPRYIQATDPGSAIDRWTFIQPAGCTTTSAVQGSGGVLVGQHCGDGDHLLLRDAYSGDDDNDKAKSKWRLPSDAIPVSADQLIAALDPHTGKLLVYDPADGKVQQTQALSPSPALSPAPSISSVSANNEELVTIGAMTYALDASSGRQLWSAQLAGPPTAQSANLLAITAQGVTELDLPTGKVIASYSIPAPPASSRAVKLGTGFVVAGSSTTVYH